MRARVCPCGTGPFNCVPVQKIQNNDEDSTVRRTCYMILVGAERIYVRINRQRHLEVCADGLLHSAGDAQCCSDQSSLSASICLTGRREGTLTEQTRWKQM